MMQKFSDICFDSELQLGASELNLLVGDIGQIDRRRSNHSSAIGVSVQAGSNQRASGISRRARLGVLERGARATGVDLAEQNSPAPARSAFVFGMLCRGRAGWVLDFS